MKLFIGGVNDGRWLDIPDLPTIVLALPPTTCEEAKPTRLTPVEVERYRATQWNAGSQRFVVYVLEGMPLNEAFVRLLLNYKPVKPPASGYLEEDCRHLAPEPKAAPSASRSSLSQPLPSSEDSPAARSES